MQYNSIKTRTTSNELRWTEMNYNKIRQKYTKTKIQIDGKKVNKKTKNKDINFLSVFFTLFSKLLVFMFSSPVFSDGCVLYCVSVHHLFLCFSQLSCFFSFLFSYVCVLYLYCISRQIECVQHLFCVFRNYHVLFLFFFLMCVLYCICIVFPDKVSLFTTCFRVFFGIIIFIFFSISWCVSFVLYLYCVSRQSECVHHLSRHHWTWPHLWQLWMSSEICLLLNQHSQPPLSHYARICKKPSCLFWQSVKLHQREEIAVKSGHLEGASMSTMYSVRCLVFRQNVGLF